MAFEEKLLQALKKEMVFIDEPMEKHLSFKTGGNADYFVVPSSCTEIIKVINICKEEKIPFYILGKGSNVLVTDKGFRGVIINIGENISNITLREDNKTIYVEAGISLSNLSNFAMENGLTGLEFASGIPGSLGGGIYMNAGAYDGDISFVIESVTLLNPETGKVSVFDKSEMDFGYRTSKVQKERLIVLEANISLEKADKHIVKEKMDSFNEQRANKQPLEYPSAGSVFKRPIGFYAGKLIMDSGLKGKTIGGAQVSEKHCGFIINYKNATATDIINLIEHVRDVVFEKQNVKLERELRIIGE